MIKKTKNTNGITLIALVITIIVLLILAGVSIATLTGDNGILNQANEAKKETESAEIKEKIQLSVMGSRMYNTNSGKIDLEKLEKELDEMLGTDISITKDGENDELPWTVEKDGYSYEIDENGKVTGEGEEEKPTIDDLNAPVARVAAITNSDNTCTKVSVTVTEIESIDYPLAIVYYLMPTAGQYFPHEVYTEEITATTDGTYTTTYDFADDIETIGEGIVFFSITDAAGNQAEILYQEGDSEVAYTGQIEVYTNNTTTPTE